MMMGKKKEPKEIITVPREQLISIIEEVMKHYFLPSIMEEAQDAVTKVVMTRYNDYLEDRIQLAVNEQMGKLVTSRMQVAVKYLKHDE